MNAMEMKVMDEKLMEAEEKVAILEEKLMMVGHMMSEIHKDMCEAANNLRANDDRNLGEIRTIIGMGRMTDEIQFILKFLEETTTLENFIRTLSDHINMKCFHCMTCKTNCIDCPAAYMNDWLYKCKNTPSELG